MFLSLAAPRQGIALSETGGSVLTLSLFLAIAQANLAGIQNYEHQRGKVIQLSVAGSCSAWASPGLKRC